MNFLIWGHVFDDFVHESLEVDLGFRLRCLLDHFSRGDIQRRKEVESAVAPVGALQASHDLAARGLNVTRRS